MKVELTPAGREMAKVVMEMLRSNSFKDDETSYKIIGAVLQEIADMTEEHGAIELANIDEFYDSRKKAEEVKKKPPVNVSYLKLVQNERS